jgi:hypothetical protein
VENFLSRLNNPSDIPPIQYSFLDENLFSISTKTPWFADLANYLATGKLPSPISSKEKNKIIKYSDKYSRIKGDIFYTRPDLIICRCLREDLLFYIFKAYHDEPFGGIFVDKQTSYKIIHLGYYWTTLFRDAKKYVRSCDCLLNF